MKIFGSPKQFWCSPVKIWGLQWTLKCLHENLGVSNKNLGSLMKIWWSPMKILGSATKIWCSQIKIWGASTQILRSPMKIWGSLIKFWGALKFWGSKMKILEVSIKIGGSPMQILESLTKIWDLQWNSGGLQWKSGGLLRKCWVSQKVLGVSNENLVSSMNFIGFTMKIWGLQ